MVQEQFIKPVAQSEDYEMSQDDFTKFQEQEEAKTLERQLTEEYNGDSKTSAERKDGESQTKKVKLSGAQSRKIKALRKSATYRSESLVSRDSAVQQV